jgi:hypothetical protein
MQRVYEYTPLDDHAAISALIRITVPTPASSSRAIRRIPLPAANSALMAATLAASACSSERRPSVTPSALARASPDRWRSAG